MIHIPCNCKTHTNNNGNYQLTLAVFGKRSSRNLFQRSLVKTWIIQLLSRFVSQYIINADIKEMFLQIVIVLVITHELERRRNLLWESRLRRFIFQLSNKLIRIYQFVVQNMIKKLSCMLQITCDLERRGFPREEVKKQKIMGNPTQKCDSQ